MSILSVKLAARENFQVAHASRVLAPTSRQGELFCPIVKSSPRLIERSFWRDAKTSTRDACATQAKRRTTTRLSSRAVCVSLEILLSILFSRRFASGSFAKRKRDRLL